VLFGAGCRSRDTAQRPADVPPPSNIHYLTAQLDRWDQALADARQNFAGEEYDSSRLAIYNQRWQTVQQAVAHHGVMHRDAFYGSRAYWHTGSTTGLGWAIDHEGDLNDPVYVDGRGNVRVHGDVNDTIEVGPNAIVHILGDLNATLELSGVCEVVIAGSLNEDATIICDGQLELFVGGNSSGVFGATGSATIIIDGNAAGVIQCGAPATTLTVTGNMLAQLPPPRERDAVLTLRVDGYTPSAFMRSLAAAGFTRVNATLGISDVPPGLYPADDTSNRPTARWTVLQQRTNDQ